MVVVSSNFSAPVEGVLYQSPGIKMRINDQDLGTGSLYITENNVVWGGAVSPSGAPVSTISLLYPTISMHAVQREPSAALFLVLNYELRLPEMAQTGSGDAPDDDDDDEFDPDNQPITQLRFVPQNDDELQAMYNAMSAGQSLHPDPDDEVELEDNDHYMDGQDFDDDEEFEDAEENTPAGDEAAARLRALRIQHANGGNNVADDIEDAAEAEE